MMKNMFYIGYLISMLFIVVAAEAVNLVCSALFDKKPIKWFEI